jgi:hypothetical protein
MIRQNAFSRDTRFGSLSGGALMPSSMPLGSKRMVWRKALTELQSASRRARTREPRRRSLAQRRAFLVHPVPSLAECRSDRQRLERFDRDNLQAIVEAISADFGHRDAHETVLLDVARSLAGIGQCRQPQPAIGPWSR